MFDMASIKGKKKKKNESEAKKIIRKKCFVNIFKSTLVLGPTFPKI